MPGQTTTNANTERGYRKQFLLSLAGFVVLLMVFKLNTDDKPATYSGVPATQNPAFNKKTHSLTDPASIWVIVNKQHALQPSDYTPTLVKPDVALKPGRSSTEMQIAPVMSSPLQQLFAAADKTGLHLRLSSAYRSYTYQVRVYKSIVASTGQASADEQSARPGYSEHQTGFAVDIAPLSGTCELSQCFAETPEGQWIANNAYKYGFLVRYPKDKETVTGYEYEPWHIRYIGVSLATELHNTKTETLEEFFNVSGGTVYK